MKRAHLVIASAAIGLCVAVTGPLAAQHMHKKGCCCGSMPSIPNIQVRMPSTPMRQMPTPFTQGGRMRLPYNPAFRPQVPYVNMPTPFMQAGGFRNPVMPMGVYPVPVPVLMPYLVYQYANPVTPYPVAPNPYPQQPRLPTPVTQYAGYQTPTASASNYANPIEIPAENPASPFVNPVSTFSPR